MMGCVKPLTAIYRKRGSVRSGTVNHRFGVDLKWGIIWLIDSINYCKLFFKKQKGIILFTLLRCNKKGTGWSGRTGFLGLRSGIMSRGWTRGDTRFLFVSFESAFVAQTRVSTCLIAFISKKILLFCEYRRYQPTRTNHVAPTTLLGICVERCVFTFYWESFLQRMQMEWVQLFEIFFFSSIRDFGARFFL